MLKDLQLRPVTGAERLYLYSQSPQIDGQTGCVGHLRADLEAGSDRFFSVWEDHRPALKTGAFREELNRVVDAFRFAPATGGFLRSRGQLEAFCRAHPEAALGNALGDYGLRADTYRYSYLLRLNPRHGIYHAYVYCYTRPMLDTHLYNAGRGVRFVDSGYRELFRVPDGEPVRIVYAGGQIGEYVVRYVDDYHVELNGDCFHIHELAGILERGGSRAEPVSRVLGRNAPAERPAAGEERQ